MASRTGGGRSGRNRRAEVMEAAVDLFYRQGYAGTSMSELATTVGLLKGSLYHYTGSKEALLTRIFEQGAEDSLAVLDQISRMEISAGERLRELVRSWSLWYMENLPVATIYLAEWKHLSGARRRTTVATRRSVYERIARFVDGVKAEGGAPAELESRYASLFILSVLNGLTIWFDPKGEDPPRALAEDYADMVVRMLAHTVPGTLSERPRPAEPATAVDDSAADERSGELLRAAITVFGREGYASASMAEIAAEASLLRGSIYHYMDSKEGLLEQIAEKAAREFLLVLDRAEAGDGSDRERLGEMVRALTQWCADNPELVGVHTTQWRHLRPSARTAGQARREVAYAKLFARLRAAVPGADDGASEAPFQPRSATLFLLSAITGLPGWYRRSGEDSGDRVAAIWGDLAIGLVSAYRG